MTSIFIIIYLTLNILFAHSCELSQSHLPCSCHGDFRWNTFRCSNTNPMMDEKTILLSSIGSVEWPEDLFCLAIRRNLKVSGAYQITSQLLSIAPNSGRGEAGIAFNVKDQFNFDFAVLRFMNASCTMLVFGYVENDHFVEGLALPCQTYPRSNWQSFRLYIDTSKQVLAYINGNTIGKSQAYFSTVGFGGVVVPNGFGNIAQFRDFDVSPYIKSSSDCCPFPYVKIAGICLYVSPSNDKRSYHDAIDYCASINGRLYEPREKSTFTVIGSYLENILHFKLPRNDYTWMGVNDITNEGTFVYQSDNKNLLFTSWQTKVRQPDNAGSHEHCVEMFYLSATGWNDRTCTHLNRFLCETPNL